MIILLSRQLMDVLPEIADHYLDFNTFEYQRGIRDWHVDELYTKMKNGLFRYGNIAFCRLKGEDRKVLVDGQHVCHAITRHNEIVPAVVEHWEVGNERERSLLFRQYELLTRGLPEMVNVEAGALKIPWPKWVINLVVGGIGIDLGKKNTGRISHGGVPASPSSISSKTITGSFQTKEKKVAALRLYINEGGFINSILAYGKGGSTKKDVRHIARGPVVYAMMETWRKNKVKAKEFWEQVRDGEYLSKESPTKKLREFLIETSGVNQRTGMRTPNNHQYIYRAFVAWNAFIDGRKTSLRYRPELQPPALKAYSEKTGGKQT